MFRPDSFPVENSEFWVMDFSRAEQKSLEAVRPVQGESNKWICKVVLSLLSTVMAETAVLGEARADKIAVRDTVSSLASGVGVKAFESSALKDPLALLMPEKTEPIKIPHIGVMANNVLDSVDLGAGVEPDVKEPKKSKLQAVLTLHFE